MADLNTALSPSPVATCETATGQTGTSFTGDVTVELINNPTGATLGGTTTQTAVAGLATFDDLTLNRSGKGFKLRATANNLKSSTSDAFDIATACAFTSQPVNTLINVTMAAVVVQIQDGSGNADTEYDGEITISKWVGPGNLTGTTAKAAVSGTATFSDLKVDQVGAYSLMASAEVIETAYPAALVISDSFNITTYLLTISSNTSNYNVHSAFVSAFGTPPANANLLVTVNSGVTISSSSTATPAMSWGTPWTGTPIFSLINNGTIQGKSGSGGSASATNDGGAGGNGGVGLAKNGNSVTVTNHGTIAGGTGGGGGGGGVFASTNPDGQPIALSGGGGAGSPGGGHGSSTNALVQATDGGSSAGGTGATTDFMLISCHITGQGGDGGGLGQPGQSGSAGSSMCTPPGVFVSKSGGAAGANGTSIQA